MDLARVTTRITALELLQDKLDTYPVDEVQIGDKKFKIEEARVVIDSQLDKLYRKRDELNGVSGGFLPIAFQDAAP